MATSLLDVSGPKNFIDQVPHKCTAASWWPINSWTCTVIWSHPMKLMCQVIRRSNRSISLCTVYPLLRVKIGASSNLKTLLIFVVDAQLIMHGSLCVRRICVVYISSWERRFYRCRYLLERHAVVGQVYYTWWMIYFIGAWYMNETFHWYII